MPRIQTYIDAETISTLTEFSKQKDVSVSNAISSIVKDYFKSDRSPLLIHSTLDCESKSYFLRILNTLNQVLMCVYDQDKAGLKAESAKACIQEITKQIQAFVEMPRQ